MSRKIHKYHQINRRRQKANVEVYRSEYFNIQGGHKLVVKKEGFIIHSYTAKHESTNDYEIQKLTKLLKPRDKRSNDHGRHGITTP